MGVKMTEEQFGKFGTCVFLDNGLIRLGVTVDFGPRLIYFAVNGKENVMFQDPDRTFSEPAGEYGLWYCYGGHRLWCSPEVNPETYYPDNNKVEYTYDGGKLILTPPATPFGKLFSMQIEMSENSPLIKLTHKIKNVSDKPCTFAAWSISSFTVGGVCFVPLSNKPTGYLANRTISLWDYSDLKDPRLDLTNYAIRLEQDVNAKVPFKAGLNSEDGFIAYAVNGQVIIKSFDGYDENVTYPDYGCNLEFYTNAKFLECECLGEIREFAPGETTEISEEWRIYESSTDFKGDYDAIKAELAEKIASIK